MPRLSSFKSSTYIGMSRCTEIKREILFLLCHWPPAVRRVQAHLGGDVPATMRLLWKKGRRNFVKTTSSSHNTICFKIDNLLISFLYDALSLQEASCKYILFGLSEYSIKNSQRILLRFQPVPPPPPLKSNKIERIWVQKSVNSETWLAQTSSLEHFEFLHLQ